MRMNIYSFVYAFILGLILCVFPMHSALAKDAEDGYSLQGHWYLELQGGLSIFDDDIDGSMFAETFAFTLTAGYGVTRNLVLFLSVEESIWHQNEVGNRWDPGVFNAGIGFLYQIYAPHVFALLGDREYPHTFLTLEGFPMLTHVFVGNPNGV